MYLIPQLLIIVLAFMISFKHEAINIAYAQSYTSVVAPIHKHVDAAKPLYSVQITTFPVNVQDPRENFLIDIDAPLIWHECIVQWNMHPGSCPSNTRCTSSVSCEEYECTHVRTSYTYKDPSCPLETNISTTMPGNWIYCTCPANVVNPVTGSCGQALLNYDEFYLNTSDGRNVLTGLSGAFPNAACAPSSSFVSFPANVTGVVGFSSSPYALPFNMYYLVRNTLALCLPSKPSVTGVLFFGPGPYYLLPQSSVDVRSYLSYTPLLKHQDSFGYFISVNSIVIKKRAIDIPANTTTKLSTIDPYTTLRTDIYNRVVRRFSMVTKRLSPTKPVAPFGLCYNTSTTGLKVPDIDFSLPDGKKWTVSTTNSIKQVTSEVACFAFVDGGATSETPIVIGAFQFEDNFLEFDLENSTLGFSSSLLRKQTSCANFNFTLIKSPL